MYGYTYYEKKINEELLADKVNDVRTDYFFLLVLKMLQTII